MAKKRRRALDPQRARAAATGGWYGPLPAPDPSTWPTCSRCGMKASVMDSDGECLQCRVALKKNCPPGGAGTGTDN